MAVGKYTSDLERGDVLGPVEYTLSPFVVREYCHAVELHQDYFQGTRDAIMPPTLIHLDKLRLYRHACPMGTGPHARVHIEYDVELDGAQKKVELPFVIGVLADLSGKPAEALPGVQDRKFMEIDVDNFDKRMKSMKPRAAFQVKNTLTGEGQLSVDLTFESMDDFSPAAIARKVEPLKKLFDARTELSNLLTYMDGRSGAEELVAKLLADPALLQSLAAAPKPTAEAQS